MSSPTVVRGENPSADFWQKNHSRPPAQPPSNGDLQQYFWSGANPFYDHNRNGLRPTPPTTTKMTINGNGQLRPSGPPPPQTATVTATIKRNPFPLTLPLYHNLPRAQLRRDDNGNGGPPTMPRASNSINSPTGYHTPLNGISAPPTNGNGNLANGYGTSSVGYKLAQNGGSAPPLMQSIFAEPRRAAPPKKGSEGVWTVEADRIVRDGPRRQPTALVPPAAVAKYGDKNGGLPSRQTPPRTSRKQHKWSRFMQSLCCCVAPQRENELHAVEKPRSSSKSGGGQQNGIAISPPPNSSSPITQIEKPPMANGMVLPPSSSPITQITPEDGVLVVNGQLPTPDVVPQYRGGVEKLLLPPMRPQDEKKKCLIIDLDETLVHSSFKPVKNPDFVIPVEIDGIVHQVYVLKRPHVDEFLARVGEKFECVLFTASLAKYADPVADLLDKRGVFRSRLFREACVFHKGNYIKDLARLGRDLNRTIIVDNSPTSYAFHPENAIPVQTWFDDPSDVELLDILHLLDRLAQVDSVYSILRSSNSSPDSTALLDRAY